MTETPLTSLSRMHIRKYCADYSRRHFIKQMAQGAVSAGVLMPLWKAIAATGEITGAYPDELMSIDAYTKGKISTGDTITADNVGLIKELLDPIQYQQISTQGRQLKMLDTTTEIMQLSPWEYIEATLSNQGQARFDASGNVVTIDGKPWIGGNPFPDPKSAIEYFANITLSWGRHDVSFYAIKEYDLDQSGNVAYNYQTCWIEMSATGRIRLEPKPYLPGHEDKLRYQTVFFVYPNDAKGTAYLNIWAYDQNKYPELYGYLPAFKRVRRFPTNQRFEPLVPGSSLYLSDAWAAGDPLLTWGNYKIVHRGPGLAAVSRSWNNQHPNWEHGTHGGEYGKTFWDTAVEFIPEVVVVEAEPVGFPRAPVSKKRVWFDVRTMLPISMVSYDRRGDIFRSFDGAYSLYESANGKFMDGDHPYWSWTRVHAHNVQTNRITRLEQVKEINGGYRTEVNNPDQYDKFLTKSALSRLGT